MRRRDLSVKSAAGPRPEQPSCETVERAATESTDVAWLSWKQPKWQGEGQDPHHDGGLDRELSADRDAAPSRLSRVLRILLLMHFRGLKGVARGRPGGRFEIVAKISKATPHVWCEDGLVLSRLNKVFIVSDLERPSLAAIAQIPWRPTQRLAHVRLVDRVAKHSILQVHRTEHGRFLISNGSSWWCCATRGAQVLPVSRFSPTRPMNRGICESPSGCTYIADYTANHARLERVRIHRTSDFVAFETAWEFAPGQIRHVHALIRDPEDDRRIWVLTGDRDSESRILYTDDEFRSVQCFLNAGQTSRATDLLVRDGTVYWGMDSPSVPAHLMAARKERPQEARTLCELPGPAYYMGANEAGGAYLGTTVEPGFASKDRCAHLFGMRPDGVWEEVLKRRADIFPQHGILYFPRGTLPDSFVVFSQRGLVPDEGSMVIARDRAWE